MSSFPEYLVKHNNRIRDCFLEEGSVPVHWKYFIAYIASATHRCEYLMKLEEELCRISCRTDWFAPELRGQLPDKLQMLGQINVKLAHRPWEISKEDVSKLLEKWTITELMEALVTLCIFHSLAGFVWGTGVAPEYDLPLTRRRKMSSTEAALRINRKVDIIPMLRNYTESEFGFSEDIRDVELNNDEEDEYFAHIAGGYLPYVNFDIRTFSKPVSPSDFSFAIQGYNILSKYVPVIADVLRETTTYTYSLTHEYIGAETGISTGPLRRAVWNYVQRVYGLQYDDYDYREVNQFLPIQTKSYIKKVACFPHTVTEADYKNIELDLTHEEMIHINLLITEARLESELIYMLHAVAQALELI